jgi:hypothetical protein
MDLDFAKSIKLNPLECMVLDFAATLITRRNRRRPPKKKTVSSSPLESLAPGVSRMLPTGPHILPISESPPLGHRRLPAGLRASDRESHQLTLWSE